MDRRILDEAIARKVSYARDTLEKFRSKVSEDTTDALVWYLDDAFLACQQERIFLSVENNIKTSAVRAILDLTCKELSRSASRLERSTSPGTNMMSRARVAALAEAVELLQQAVQEEVEQAA